MSGEPLPRDFYQRPTLAVARDLLGKRLMYVGPDGLRRGGRIVETEAYVGPDDAASHARSGPGGRAGVMFGPAGVAYVYLIYGIHRCFNAVTEQSGFPGAVLVRAIEPQENLEGERTSGPGLVCRALRLDVNATGLPLTQPPLTIEDGLAVPDECVLMGPRVGVDFAGTWASKPWRLWDASSAYVSRSRKGQPLDPAILQM